MCADIREPGCMHWNSIHWDQGSMTDRYIGDPGVGELRENGSIGQRRQLQNTT
jgi:hypothetical protein